MNDYDVWFVHDYFSVYCVVFCDYEDEVIKTARQFLTVDNGVPTWMVDDAQDIIVEKKGSMQNGNV